MKELKTLKDLETRKEVKQLMKEKNILINGYISRYDLKQEAIKWIKADGEYLVKDTKTWIMLFFNIKKEDLK